jgi:hypothetical protein
MRVTQRSVRPISLLDDAARLKGTSDIEILRVPLGPWQLTRTNSTARRLVITFVTNDGAPLRADCGMLAGHLWWGTGRAVEMPITPARPAPLLPRASRELVESRWRTGRFICWATRAGERCEDPPAPGPLPVPLSGGEGPLTAQEVWGGRARHRIRTSPVPVPTRRGTAARGTFN